MARLIPAMGLILAIGCGCSGPSRAKSPSHSEEPSHPEGPNLIPNPSFETLDGATPPQPAGWTTDQWGKNAATFRIDTTDAHSGARSAVIDMTSWSSGDAKWIFDPIPVSTGMAFIYRDYFRSSVPSRLVAVYFQENGERIYESFPGLQASADWSSAAAEIAIPPGTVRLTVYHLIESVGTLHLDDVSLGASEVPDLTSGVPNGSFEKPSTVHPNLPLAWHSSSAGDNTAKFEYVAGGHTGSRSVRLTVSRYANGDAKWYFDVQPVTPGTRYLYSDWYVSTSPSFLMVRVTMHDGTLRYIKLGEVPAASRFTVAQATFLAPAGARGATVFRGLARTGTLQIDDVKLSVALPVALVNGVPNGDLELPAFDASDSPAGWHPNVWGTSSTAFSWPSEGHSGSHCARIDVTSYVDGAASWWFDPQPVDGKQLYRVTASYRSNVDFAILATVTLSDLTSVNRELPAALAASDWTPYSAKLYLPANAVDVTIHYKLAHTGWMEIDDAGLQPTTNLPFQRGLVSLTFDDGWATDLSKATPVLERHGAVATHYIITGFLGRSDRLSSHDLSVLAARGDEIGSHTLDHADLTTLSAAALEAELANSKQLLASFGPVLDFAAPDGAYDGAVLNAIKRHYATHRGIDAGFNTLDDFDPYRLKVQKVDSKTILSEVDEWAARAVADRSWLILVYHGVADAPTSIYDVTTANLEAQLSAIQDRKLAFVTIRQAMSEIAPQLAP